MKNYEEWGTVDDVFAFLENNRSIIELNNVYKYIIRDMLEGKSVREAVKYACDISRFAYPWEDNAMPETYREGVEMIEARGYTISSNEGTFLIIDKEGRVVYGVPIDPTFDMVRDGYKFIKQKELQ